MKYSIFILLTFILTSCYKEDDYLTTNYDKNDIITSIGSSQNNIVANGRDESSIQITLPDDASISTMVEFTTSKGTFANSGDKSNITVQAFYKNFGDTIRVVAEATLISGLKTGNAIVTAKVGGFSDTTHVFFRKNYPTSLNIIPSNISILSGANAEQSIQVEAFSPLGKVSDDHEITIKAIHPLTGDTLGSFRTGDKKSTLNQSVSFLYTLMPDTLYNGEIWIISNSQNSDLSPISDTVSIYSY
jgi:hypothetical protein